MTGPETRTIRRSRLTSSAEISELLQLLLVTELLYPSSCLWLVSPWISDISVVDNSVLGFADLNREWGSRRVRLTEVLLRLAQLGTTVVVATRLTDDRNQDFVTRLRAMFFEYGLDNDRTLVLRDDDGLHEKGVAADDFHLSGSMNLTWNGVHVASEVVTLFLARDQVQRARRSFYERYGGRFVDTTA